MVVPTEVDRRALAERLREATELLEAIAADRTILAGVPDRERARLLQAVALVYHPDRAERRRMAKETARQRKAARVKEREQARFDTGIRELRRKPVFHSPNVFPPDSFEPDDIHEPVDPADRGAGSAGLPAGASAKAGAFPNAAGEMPADSVAFRLVFADPHKLAVDMPLQLDIDAEERTDTVLIPAEAVIREGGETVIFVAAGSRAERRSVKTGIEDEARIEITDGLRAGELVITRGHLGLTDGAAVTVATGR